MRTPFPLRRIAVAALATVVLSCATAQTDPALRIAELEAFDPTSETPLGALSDGAAIGPGGTSVEFVAETGPATPGSVRFLLDGVVIALDDEPPFTAVLRLTPDGPVAQPTTDGATTVDLAVAAGTDDAEEFLEASALNAESYPAGYTYVTSSDLELGRDPDHAPQAVAVRLQDVPIPSGATIVSARLLFVARGTSDGPLALAIDGEVPPDSDAFSQDPNQAGAGGITGRAATNASATWNLAPEDAWANGETYASADVAGIVQELVGHPAWRQGASLAFRIVPAGGDGYRRAHAFDNGGRQAPRLEVTYMAPGAERAFAWGEHTLTAVPYPEPGGGGLPGEALSVTFELVDAPATAPAPEAQPADEAQSEPDARAQPVEVPPAGPDDPPEPEAPEAGPTDAADPEVRRVRFPIVPLDAGGVQGSALVTAYPNAPIVLAVSLPVAPEGPFRLELRRGDCTQQGEFLAELAPFRPGIGSITPLSIGWTTLRVGNLSIWVTPLDGGDGAACAAFGQDG